MASFADKPILSVTTPAEWRHWLETVADPDGVRLRIRKKDAVDPGLSYAEALDEALCFGWIDGQAGRLDEQFRLISFTPRRRASPWSVVNTEHVARLIAEGRMRAEGQAEIDRAKADGRWDAAYRQKDGVIPDDLRLALEASPAASAFFAGLPSQSRFRMVLRLTTLKREATRQARIAEYLAMLERGEAPGG